MIPNAASAFLILPVLIGVDINLTRFRQILFDALNHLVSDETRVDYHLNAFWDRVLSPRCRIRVEPDHDARMVLHPLRKVAAPPS